MFEKLFGITPKQNHLCLSKDDVAELLKVSPETFAAFERAYEKHALNTVSDNFFDVNSRDAARAKRAIALGSEAEAALQDRVDPGTLTDLKLRIVNELLAQTQIFSYDGSTGAVKSFPHLPHDAIPVQQEEISALPKHLRPQLTGNLMQVDISQPSYQVLLSDYRRFQDERDPKKKMLAYNLFRQGLDILDLDAITYEIIGTNPNSMGHWLPQLVNACAGQTFFKIPSTTIAKVPMPLLQLTRLEYQDLTQTTLDIVDQWAEKAFDLNPELEYFIKTGIFSSKFDFRNAHVHSAKEVRELGEYLLYIHHQTVCMAGPLCTPCIFGAATTNEWVVRDFIPDVEKNPTIYKGLPLHTEYRIFIDCDRKTVIGVTPYWEPNTMKQRFGHENDADSPHQIHDYVIYKTHEETLMCRYTENVDRVVAHFTSVLGELDLAGQWSVDVMQNGDDFWIIDMGVAENSAFYTDCVPSYLRQPRKENWIPLLPHFKD